MQRIEDIYLARRADQQRGHKLRGKPMGLAVRQPSDEISSPEENSSPSINTEQAIAPKPKRPRPALERRLSLEEMGRRSKPKLRRKTLDPRAW
jgi:hypothetical protein